MFLQFRIQRIYVVSEVKNLLQNAAKTEVLKKFAANGLA